VSGYKGASGVNTLHFTT